MSAAEIAELNDRLRQTFSGGRVVMTAQVAALDPGVRAEVLERVRTFTDFNAGNDPYGEHDFGVVDVQDERYFFKIDYYERHSTECPDLSIKFGSENPSDPTVTARVLTIGRMSDL
jgi:Protein of unknown function (DUF3768)